MSVAEWEGIPLAEVVARLKPTQGRHRGAGQRLRSHRPGVAALDRRRQLGVPARRLSISSARFSPSRMNGEPVPADHGKPVRLAVPGWYGCSWIKWVNEIRLVGPDEPATSQMVEFAARTHQSAPHKYRARLRAGRHPYRRHAGARRETQGPQRPRISHRRHRVGRHQAVDRLAIRFANDQPFTPFAICPAPKTHTMWSLWEYRWKPAAPGTYDISLEVAGSVGAAAASEVRLLHAASQDRRDLSAIADSVLLRGAK